MLGACFGGCGGQLVPPYHTELGREELKALYDKSVAVNNGRLIVHGIFARADTKNNNKRVYPRWILKREVTKYEFAHISKGTALGELDHPNYASRYFKCLNLPNISHQVLEVQWKGDQLWGSIEVLSTPSGLLLRELYSQGIKLGVSSRGWASLRTDPKAKCVFVDEDFELITFDFVTEPSTKGAYLVPIKCAYRQRVPDQSKCTQIAHLGHGVVSMRSIPRLPDLPTLVMRVNELQTKVGLSFLASAASTKASLTHTVTGPPACSPQCEHLADSRQTGLQQQPAASSQAQQALPVAKAHMLDELLLFSHYIVFQAATYIDREQHARDFQSHLAMFATRAHLADQQQLMNRADLNAIILREMAREEAAAAAAAAAAAPPSPALPALAGSAHCSIPAPTSQTTPAKQAKTAPCSAAEPAAGGGGRSDSKMSQACASHSHSALSAGTHLGPSPPHSTSMSASHSSGADAAAAPGRPTHAAQHANSQHSPEACTGPSSSDLTAWTLHPNAIDVHSNTDIATIADQLQQHGALSTSTSRRATSPCIQEPPLPLPLPSHLPPQGSGQDCHLAPPAPTLSPFTLTPPPPAALVLPGCSLPDALPGDGRTPGLAGRLPAHRPVSGGQRSGAAWGKAEGAMGHAPCLPGVAANQRLLAAAGGQGQGADASPAVGPPGPGQRGSQGLGQALQAVPGWQPSTQQSQQQQSQQSQQQQSQQSQQSQQQQQSQQSQQQQQASPWLSPPRKPGAALASGYGESTTGCGSVSEEVAAELQRIRSTLAHFAEKYNQAQRAVMRMYNAKLPVPESGISITLDLSTRL